MLQAFAPGLWLADGPTISAAAGFHYPTRMAVLHLQADLLAVWSPVPLTPDLRAEVDALGQVTDVVAPNHLHHMSVADWVQAYPSARLWAPPGLRAKRPDLAFHGELEDEPLPHWQGEIDQVVLRGNRIAEEVVFFHKASCTVLFTDLLQQMPRDWYAGWRRVVARLDLMTEPTPTVPRKFRLAFTGRAEARKALRRILDWPIESVVMAHGTPIRSEAKAHLAKAFRFLGP